MATSRDEALSSAMSSLSIGNDTPGPSRRKAKLRVLIDSLEPWELWHVRALVKERLTIAELPSLPEEILGMITHHLDEYDIAACVQTCRAWNASFKRPGVARYLIAQAFPGVLLQGPTAPERQAMQEDPAALYQRLAKRQALRRDGRFHAVLAEEAGTQATSFRPEAAAHPSGEYPRITIVGDPILTGYLPRESAYSHGRVTWEFGASCTCIDNLYTLERRIIKWPDAEDGSPANLSLVCMTEKLVIFVNMPENDKSL